MVCRDRASLSRQSLIAPARTRSVVSGSLLHSQCACLLFASCMRSHVQGALSLRASVVPCRDTRAMSRHWKPQVRGFSVATENFENPVVTHLLCHDTRPQKSSVETEKIFVTTQVTQYAWEPCRNAGRPCRDIEPGGSVARAGLPSHTRLAACAQAVSCVQPGTQS